MLAARLWEEHVAMGLLKTAASPESFFSGR